MWIWGTEPLSSERIEGDLNHFSSPKVEFGENHFRGVYTCVPAHGKAEGHGVFLLSFSTCFFFEIQSKCVTEQRPPNQSAINFMMDMQFRL